ncbi:MAG: ABC transporter permease [Gammaproteobacteria bacterium]|nr:ABC transporter permease [Gammaproteobacteria bacterium]NNC98205.1 ABC transporter permease [Gammaproteobacteria bacterium]NNM14847.1 ABC transporter permease [Gammaproteobacteria bacterium]
MRSLNKKIIRDLWHLRGQVLAIGLVIAAGVATLLMSLSTLEALDKTCNAYYERYHFADVFVNLKRAPQSLERKISAIPGVRNVENRIVSYVTVEIPEFNEPVMAQIVSVPETGQPVLNQLSMRQGGWLEPGQKDQVILNEPFADAHDLHPGDTFVAILNGKRRRLSVAGVALSPEFIYSIGPGALMPDDLRYGVMWMGQKELSAAFDLQDSFNSLSLGIMHGVNPKDVIKKLDLLIEPYGGVGAIPRADQISNWFVTNEIEQLKTMSLILPAIFLAVAAFLTNMVLARLLANERSYIGLMKAFGYRDIEVTWHYAKLVLGICAVGIAVGSILGAWFGFVNTEMYAEAFRFPILIYQLSPKAVLIASLLSCAAALAGAMLSLQRVASLPPAQAMLPPAPPAYRSAGLLKTRFGEWLDQPTRIIARNISRTPFRSALTVVGLASSIGLLIMTLQWTDSINYIAERQFYDAQRQDIMVGLAETKDKRVLHEFAHMPGVLAVEPMHIVSADFSNGAITHRGGIQGIPGNAQLQPIYDDASHSVIPPPAEGLVLGSYLAQKLQVRPGDYIEVDVLEGRRPHLTIPVVATFETNLAMPAYMNLASLNRILLSDFSIEYVSLLIDKSQQQELFNLLRETPAASSVMLKQAAIDAFYDTLAEHMMVFIGMFTSLAVILGFGVAYNSARIALSERGRELATLRVLGFRRTEVSYILLGELSVLMILALPVGAVMGIGLCRIMANAFATELFRVPMVLTSATYAKAMIICIVATIFSALIVRHRVEHLNMIKVLKTRE